MVKKVIGITSENIKPLFFVLLLYTCHISKAQLSFTKSLSEAEWKWFGSLMQNVDRNINKYDLESAEKDLADLFGYTKTLSKKTEQEKIEYFLAIHCAMSFTVNGLKVLNGEMDYANLILEGEECLNLHRQTFRQQDEFFSAVDWEYNILTYLPRLYKLKAQSLQDVKYYQLALDRLSEAENIIRYNSDWKSKLSEIWYVKAGLLRDMGRNIEANVFDNKSIALYDSLGMSSSQDSLCYIQANIALLRNQFKSKSISERINDIQKIKMLLKKYEENVGRKAIWLEIDLLTKEAELYTLIKNYKRAEISYSEAFGVIENNILRPETTPFYLTVRSSQLDLLVKMHEWSKVIQIGENDTILRKLGGLNFSLLKAYREVEDTVKAKELVGEYQRRFMNGFSKIQNLNGVERDLYLRQFSVDFSSIYSYYYWRRYNREECNSLFDIHSKYKGAALASRSNNLFQLLNSSTEISDLIARKLSDSELFLNLIYIDPGEEQRNFFYLGTGISYQNTDSINTYPIVTDIIPFSSAYYAPNLLPGDTIIRLNGFNLQNISAESLKQKFQSIERGEKMQIELSRKDTNDKYITVTLVKDSIFKWDIRLREIFAVFSILNKQDIKSQFIEGFPIRKAIAKEYLKALLTNDKNDLKFENYLPIDMQMLLVKKRVFATLDGFLNKINIETVTVTGKNDSLYFLGDLIDVRLLSSSWDLLFNDTQTYSKKSIVLFGYPNYTLTQNEQASISKSIGIDTTMLTSYRSADAVTGNYVFTPLPATKHEVEEIGNNLKQKGWDVQIYTGNSALEAQVKAVRSPRILHIATHGFFAEDIKSETQSTFMGMDSKAALENPMLRSGLAFAGAERTRTDTTGVRLSGVEDGILTAEEVQYLNLDSTELVVLSACETGLGEIVNGEGVYGLQRAFRAAGAKSVLMSLWKVDDLATETLMKNFYKHWLDEGMTKHDALWKAKLDMRNDKVHPEWAKPFYWGAFVLVGE